jgi:hypothetical protein
MPDNKPQSNAAPEKPATVDVGVKMAVACQFAREAINELLGTVKELEAKQAAVSATGLAAPTGPTPEYRAAVQGLVDQLVTSGMAKGAEAERLVADGLASPAAILRSATVAVQEHQKRAEDFGIGGVGPPEKRADEDNRSRGIHRDPPKRPSDMHWERSFGTTRAGA